MTEADGSTKTNGALDGHVAVVTGGAGGIGFATVSLFARNGARVVICDQDSEGGEAAADRLRGQGLDARAVRLDVSEDANWSRAVDDIVTQLGRIDVLVNNAGVNTNLGLVAETPEGWDRTIAVNVRGPFLGMRHVAPIMRDGGGGAIVNVVSFSALVGYHSAAYSSSKWALRGLTKSAAGELAAWNIRVNALHPGSVPTEMHRGTPPGHGEAWRQLTPLGRLGETDDIAEAALFLASDRSRFITGTDLVVDGGLSTFGVSRARAHLLDAGT